MGLKRIAARGQQKEDYTSYVDFLIHPPSPVLFNGAAASSIIIIHSHPISPISLPLCISKSLSEDPNDTFKIGQFDYQEVKEACTDIPRPTTTLRGNLR